MSDERQTEWVEIAISVRHVDAAEVAGFLATTVPAAHAGVELRGENIVFWVPFNEGDGALRETRAAVSTLAAGGIAVDPARVELKPAAPEAEWRDAWKRHFRVTRVARRVVIVPSWEEYAPASSDVVLQIDPGRAFGTGLHASTRLCLIELDTLSSADQPVLPGGHRKVTRFLDIGTGSGILAIAAAKLWPASSGLAIDIDPVAVEVATENAQRNGVAERVSCAATPLGTVQEAFDLVMANIQMDVLRLLRDVGVQRIAPGGILILSGLLDEEARGVARWYALLPGIQALRVRQCADDPEWSAVVLQRVAG
jgi:ribosomal protein L11 methyltransferase